jgi:hypothetical protein
MAHVGKSFTVRKFSTGETGTSVTTTGDKATLSFAEPFVVTHIGVIMTVAGGSGSLVLAFDRRETVGNNTGRVDGGIGILSKAAASLTLGAVLEKAVHKRLEVGDEIVAEVTTALTTTGSCIFYVKGYNASAAKTESKTLAAGTTRTVVESD